MRGKDEVACEQALCLGKKIARKGKGRGENNAFPSPLFPVRPKACSQAKDEVVMYSRGARWG